MFSLTGFNITEHILRKTYMYIRRGILAAALNVINEQTKQY